MQLQTPARLYEVTQSESVYGGRSFSLRDGATVWGDFKPAAPALQTPSEGDAYVVLAADFTCRSSVGMTRGGRLSLKGFDWKILSLDEQPDNFVRVRIERIAP